MSILVQIAATLVISGAVAIDGDTLRIDSPGKNLRLRLWGYDAVEIKEPGGVDASRALAALIDGQTLTCELMDVDRYDRPVVRCVRPDGVDLACAMVGTPWARDWPRYSGGYYAGCE